MRVATPCPTCGTTVMRYEETGPICVHCGESCPLVVWDLTRADRTFLKTQGIDPEDDAADEPDR